MANMDPNPKSSKRKFAFTGTNCSGKTTAALGVTARLKVAGVLAEVVSSQDRKITWKDDHFPVDYRAHYGMITNLIVAEVQAELKGDAEVVITDRSVLDLYAIALYDHPDSSQVKALESMILAWAASYTKIFYLEPLEYQEDNKRPSDTFRMATHARLLEFLDSNDVPNVVQIPRNDIYKEIKSYFPHAKGNPVFEEQRKWQQFANIIGYDLVVKIPDHAMPSDVDVWIVDPEMKLLADNQKSITFDLLNKMYNTYFGSDLKLDILVTPVATSIPFNHLYIHHLKI